MPPQALRPAASSLFPKARHTPARLQGCSDSPTASTMKSLITYVQSVISDLKLFICPQMCAICGQPLDATEEGICIHCLNHMVTTNYKGQKGNPTELLLSTLGTRLMQASSFLFYQPHSTQANLFMEIKYHHNGRLAIAMGQAMAEDLSDTDFFQGIDCLLPIPLTRKREADRGYNQSLLLCRGISKVTRLPIDSHSVVRQHFKQTQTKLNAEQRAKNIAGAFLLKDPAALEGKHVLVVDDVITYGYTLRACIAEIFKAKGSKVSVLTLGMSKALHTWKRPPHIHPWD